MSCIKKYFLSFLIIVILTSHVLAAQYSLTENQYPDWIFQDITSAFTLKKGRFDIMGSWLLVNDTIDIFDIREKKIGNDSLFTSEIGDYSGYKGIINYGLTDKIMLNYMYQYGELDTTLGSSTTFKNLDSTETLDTSTHNIGIRFNLISERKKMPAISLETSYIKNFSDDAKIFFSELNASNQMSIPSGNHHMTLSDLEDQGFTAKIILSKTFSKFTPSLWIGYGKFTADTNLSLIINSNSMNSDISQKFEMDEDAFYIGLNFAIQYFERCPIFLSYYYINIDRNVESNNSLSSFIPSRYTDPERLNEETENNIFSAKIVYWLTPNLNFTFDGHLFTNHFLGIVPHYNNTFTNRFFDNIYGYIGLGIGILF